MLVVCSILQLELAAEILSTMLDKMPKDEFDIKLDESVFWTDVTAVLQYINNKGPRLQIFITNRLEIIQKNSSADHWRHACEFNEESGWLHFESPGC